MCQFYLVIFSLLDGGGTVFSVLSQLCSSTLMAAFATVKWETHFLRVVWPFLLSATREVKVCCFCADERVAGWLFTLRRSVDQEQTPTRCKIYFLQLPASNRQTWTPGQWTNQQPQLQHSMRSTHKPKLN